ncbi:NAD(P)H-dependent glycerol-3-phosphate dehydrogenase [Bartonella sp. DGB1]|uniref:NAD(P)H-dependent glycerol-3-phosphate dehydrogenase n=1 Tax=Bartonella sp. DGB1 TaxID=3239807 RepID=UPI0035269451
MVKKIAVLGGGAWGTAIAARQSIIGHEVTLYARNKKILTEINQQHKNSVYLPDCILPSSLKAGDDLEQIVQNKDCLLLVIPAQEMVNFLTKIKTFIPCNTPLVICSKGIDQESGRSMSQIVKDILPNQVFAILSGPSFACDVVQNVPVAVTIAADSLTLAENLAKILSGAYFRVYSSDDVRGVELGGALKNILAIATGMIMGYNLGLSAQAALITRGFIELRRIGVCLGGRKETFMGLSGLGDLILTCSSAQSRNYLYGVALARDCDLKQLKLAEGVATAKIAATICEEKNIDAPITKTVAKLLENEINIKQAVALLLDRPLKRED